jgi:HlyD family secretion protein
MILIISLIITLLATLEWIFIRCIPVWLVRVLVQVPLLVLTVFVAWFAGLYLTHEDPGEQQAQIEAQILDREIAFIGDLRVSVDATGAITPIRQIPLTFQSAQSPVVEIFYDAGDRVDTGALIANLDNTDAQQAVRDAEIAVALQETSYDALTSPPRAEDLAVAQAAIETAQAQLRAATTSATIIQDREIARLQQEIADNQLWQSQLARDSLTPPSEFYVDFDLVDDFTADIDNDDIAQQVEEASTTVAETLEQLNASNRAAFQAQQLNAQAAINQGELGIEQARLNFESVVSRPADPASVAGANLALEQAEITYNRLVNGPTDLQLQQATLDLRTINLALEQAEYALEQTQLTAPFPGIIAQMDLVEGQLPPQGVGVLLIDDSGYYVDLPIDETDVADVKVGQRVEFDVDALPSELVIGEVRSIAYSPLNLDNLVAYNVRVDILPTNTAAIRTGMTVTGSIITLEKADVLLVRNNFVRFDRITGDAFVTVLDADGQLDERLVLLGDRGDIYSEVLAGLEAGDEVVLVPRNDGAGLFGTQ